VLPTEMPTRARRVPAVADSLVTRHGPPNYVDAYALEARRPLAGTAEEFARTALEDCHPSVGRAIRRVHQRVLGFRLASVDSPDHVIGWRIITNEPDVIHLEAAGPLGHAALVCRRVGAGGMNVQTFLWFDHWITRPIWVLVGPAHRGVAPRFMERAVRDHKAP
jgi:hypothetical protein